MQVPRVGWVVVVLVTRDREDGWVGPEDLLGPVAVMDVPVDDRDTLEAAGFPGVLGADRGVRKDAKPPPEIGLRMVARGPGERVNVLHRPVQHRVYCRDHASGR